MYTFKNPTILLSPKKAKNKQVLYTNNQFNYPIKAYFRIRNILLKFKHAKHKLLTVYFLLKTGLNGVLEIWVNKINYLEFVYMFKTIMI